MTDPGKLQGCTKSVSIAEVSTILYDSLDHGSSVNGILPVIHEPTAIYSGIDVAFSRKLSSGAGDRFPKIHFVIRRCQHAVLR